MAVTEVEEDSPGTAPVAGGGSGDPGRGEQMTAAADAWVRLRPRPGEGRVWRLAIAYDIVGLALVAATTVLVPVNDAIALPFDEPWATPAGVGLFVAVTLLASAVGATRRGSATIGMAFAPIVAASVLGGPTAGAWVALVGVTGRRESGSGIHLYGILATHAALAVAAILGGACALAVRGMLPAIESSPLSLVVIVGVAGGVTSMAAAVAQIAFSSARLRRPVASLIRDGWPESLAASAGVVVLAMIMALVDMAAWWAVPLCVVPLASLRPAADRTSPGWLADHDALTGVLLRRAFVRRLDEAHAAAASGRHGSGLLVLDLDRFKAINDTFGHEIGDHLLREIASRLTRSLRGSDTVARLGGDEFAVILAGIASREVLLARAVALMREISEPVVLDGAVLEIGVSVGGLVIPVGGARCSDCLARAEAAMVAAKDDGGGLRLEDVDPSVRGAPRR